MNNSRFSTQYFTYSKDIYTSVLFLCPLLLLYEILSYIIFNNSSFHIRNSADVFIRNIFYYIGYSSQLLYFLLLFVFMLIFLYFNKEKYENYIFKFNYFCLMLLEGILLGTCLLVLLNSYNIFYINEFIINTNIFTNFYYCLGAGIWEEVLFRLILYNLLYRIMILFSFSKIHSTLISIFITSIMFSTFHYIGSMADYFTINTFIIRFVGGVFLCLIYIKRGLGITSMTHYSYDVLLLTLPII